MLACLAVLALAGASGAPTSTGHKRLARTWTIVGYHLQFRPITGKVLFTPAGKAIFARRLAAYDTGTLEQEPG